MRIKVCWVGKTQNGPIKSLIEDYRVRLRHLASIEIVEVPDLSKRRNLQGASLRAAECVEIERTLAADCRRVVLDEQGTQFSSPDFARWLEMAQVQAIREIAFVIGGPEGIDRALSERAYLRLSLGKMTWTHEMARALLLEQLYRAYSILRNIPYHK
jgi:23S rRNA (pseudouridine1915-N3)-methyltransferase